MSLLPAYFAERIEHEPNSGCWLWTGPRHSHDPHYSYGFVAQRGPIRNRMAHRLVYEMVVGPIPADRELDHKCRVPACVNPVHLEPVTHRENMLRGFNPAATHASKTTCPQGHPYTSDLVGFRRYRQCHAEQSMASYWRRKGVS